MDNRIRIGMDKVTVRSAWLALASIGLMAAPAVWAQQEALSEGNDELDLSIDQAYRVNAGDTLEISVWREEDLQREVHVRPDGAFSFPLAGELMAHGRTVTQIRQELEQRLARYIPDLVVTVTVTEVNGNQIFVIGQVNQPGRFVMNPALDVMQALSLAGGMTPFASARDVRILRRNGNGQQEAISFDYNRVLQGRSLDQNIVLRSGDVVVVP
jgi:polysaccharide biosynthesis/export protein